MGAMSGLTSLNVSLPQSLKDYVEKRVKGGGYSTPSEFIRALLRDDHRRHAHEELEALLLEGVNSGSPLEITPEYWQRKRRQLVARFNRKKAGNKSERPVRRSSPR